MQFRLNIKGLRKREIDLLRRSIGHSNFPPISPSPSLSEESTGGIWRGILVKLTDKGAYINWPVTSYDGRRMDGKSTFVNDLDSGLVEIFHQRVGLHPCLV